MHGLSTAAGLAEFVAFLTFSDLKCLYFGINPAMGTDTE